MPETAGAGQTRAEELRALARAYLSDEDMTIYGTVVPKVAELAARLGSEEAVNSFVSMVKVVHKDNPDDLDIGPWAAIKDFVGDIKKALVRKLRKTANAPGNVARIENIEDMRTSESPFLVSVALLLMHRRGRIWIDDFLHEVMTDWRGDGTDDVVPPYEVTDEVMRKIMVWLMSRDVETLYNVSMEVVQRAIYYVGELDHRDMLVDHVKGMPLWDRVERLKDFCTLGMAAEIDDDEGQTQEYLSAIGNNFMISLVARALKPGCEVHTMPVFLGEQGSFKSSAMKIIGGPFFGEINDSPAHKDFYGGMQGIWVGEIAEMSSISSNKVEINRVKSMLSTATDKFREPYARKHKKHPRRIVFGGTGNQDEWMRDETGGRRFYPATCGHNDLTWLTENRDQLFAEALWRYEDGATWWEVPNVAHARAIARHQVTSVYEEVIRERLLLKMLYDGAPGSPSPDKGNINADLYTPERWGNLVTTLMVAVCWLNVDFDQARQHQSEITRALTRLGWKSGSTSVWRNGRIESVRCWKVKPVYRDERAQDRVSGALVEGVLITIRTVSADAPF
jgi:putative DNA primase/helicase